MKLTIIGATGSMSGPASPASCYLLQAPQEDGSTYSLVLELGSGAFGALMRVMDPREVGGVVLSHLHADHISDMISMHVFRRWHPDGPCGPVPVLAPAGAVDRVRGVGGDGPEESYEGEFTFVDHAPGTPSQFGPFTIESFPAWHTVDAYCLRITGPSEGGGRAVVAFSGDTDSCEGLIEAARGADLFLCEAAFVDGRDEVRGIHLTGQRAGECAEEAGVKSLVLTHIQPWTPAEGVVEAARGAYAGPVEAATGEATYSL